MILDGRALSALILENIKNEITYSEAPERPMLAVVLVGDNPASLAYIKMKEKRAREVGMGFGLYKFPITISQKELEEEIRSLSRDERIHGLIIQAPLPDHIDRHAVTERIAPEKDVDGFTKTQIGNMFLGHDGLWSCTPKGVMTLLAYHHIEVVGKRVVVIGRSDIVGKPMALMLINAGATVVSCNSKTGNISEVTRSADIVIVAIGHAKWLSRDMVRKDTIVVDVGSNLLDDGTFCGDADFDDLRDHVHAISPSPGGVGPMTVATLIENTWKAYKQQKKLG